MIHNKNRIGRFTSSEIAALMKPGTRQMTEEELAKYKLENPKGRRTTIDVMFGDKAMTYIEEKKMERKLGRALNDITTAKPLIWGKMLEQRAFDLLGIEYSLISQDTIEHPEIPYWSGSPDGIKESKEYKTVIDIKCPMTLKSFCQLVDWPGLTGYEAIQKIRENHSDGEKYYWQLVSNAILVGAKYAELVVYLPYKSELQEIRDLCEETDMSPNKVAWIAFAEDDDLPYLLDGGYFSNCYVFTFEVPQADKDLLTSRVLEAGKILLL